MTLRFTSFDLLVTIWLLLIKDSFCYALELQRYPDGVTSIDTIDKCGTAGLENDPVVLNKISELNDREFWTGLGIYTLLTPWLETLGCFLLSMRPSTVNLVPSVGLCQHGCSTAYFSYNKADNTCSCLNITELQLDNGANLSSCLRTSAKTVLVYKIYTGEIITVGTEHGLCTTLTCTPPDAEYLRSAICTGSSLIKSVCEDGQPLKSQSWSLSQNEALSHCWNKDTLLLHSNACQNFALSLSAPAWTNVFREEIEVEQPLGKRTTVPTFCLSAKISDKGGPILDKNRQNCSTKLEWFVCKNGTTSYTTQSQSTLVSRTIQKGSMTSFNIGAVIGGILGACSMIIVLAVLIVCKIRSKGIFTDSNTHNYEDTSRVNFSTATYEDLDNAKHTNLTATTNQACDISDSSAPVYEEVNKN